MKNIAALIICSFLFLQCYAQADTTLVLRKGLYKSYAEYLQNAPSVTDDFIVFATATEKHDTTIKIYDYALTDSTKEAGKLWGFCDGKDVYIRHIQGFAGRRFWKLDYTGKYPYFMFYNTSVGIAGTTPLILLATATAAAFDAGKTVKILYIVMPDGDLRDATNTHFMRKLFAAKPAILAEYEALKNKFDKPKLKELIRKFSEAE